MEWNHTDSLVKKNLWSQWSVKKLVLTVSESMKRPMTVDFPVAILLDEIHLIYSNDLVDIVIYKA